MRRKTGGILLGITFLAVTLAGCGTGGSGEKTENKPQTEQEEQPEETQSEEQALEEEEAPPKTEEEESQGTVVVLLPDGEKEPARSDGENLKALLEEKNYQVVTEDAGGDALVQISQMESHLEEDPSAMILLPADVYAMTDVLTKVGEAGIPVFDVDELVRNTEDLDYYVTFDHRAMGRMVGEEIEKRGELKRRKISHDSCSIEFFMGSTDDLDALFFFNGVKEVLDPYLEDGTLVCTSGQLSFEETGTLDCDSEAVKTRMREILNTYYPDGGRPDIICTGFLEASEAVYQGLRAEGVSPFGEDWPVITGFDFSPEDPRGFTNGWLSCSVYLDRKELAEAAVEMADTLIGGDKPDVSDYSQYDNGLKIIPTRTCTGVLVDADNYQKLGEEESPPQE